MIVDEVFRCNEITGSAGGAIVSELRSARQLEQTSRSGHYALFIDGQDGHRRAPLGVSRSAAGRTGARQQSSKTSASVLVCEIRDRLSVATRT